MRYPPGPKVSFASYLALRRAPLDFLARAAREYGDIVHLQIGSRHDYLLNSPDYIKQVLLEPEGMARSSARPLRRLMGKGLLTTTGDFHHKNRRYMQSLFHGPHVRGWAEIVGQSAVRRCVGWKAGQTFDIAPEMLRLSLHAIVKWLLGIDLESEGRELSEVLEFICKLSNKYTFPSTLELLLRRPGPGQRRIDEAIERLDAILYAMIAERDGSDGTDITSEMLRLRNPESRERLLPDEQVRDELMTLIAAGHETIGNAMAWAWYLIGTHPEVEAKLQEEADAVLAEPESTDKIVCRLVYARMVLAETLRLYPPVWVFPRRPLADYKIGGYVVPAGSYFQLSPYVTQRDARFFPNPEQFDPERWRGEENFRRCSFSYFPFASGVHRCIGEGLSWTEGTLVLAMIARRWKLRLVPRQKIEKQALITLRPKYGILVRAESRAATTGAPAGTGPSVESWQHGWQ